MIAWDVPGEWEEGPEDISDEQLEKFLEEHGYKELTLEEIDAILSETLRQLARGELELIPAEELFAGLRKKLGMAEKNEAKPQEDGLDEQG